MAAPEEDVPLPPADETEPASTEEEQQPLSLLQLPGALLARILGCLPAASDVAAFGAACSTARALVAGQAWESVQTLGLHAWSPRAEGSLRWAAERFPKLRALDLEGAPLWRPCQLSPLSAPTWGAGGASWSESCGPDAGASAARAAAPPKQRTQPRRQQG